MAAGQLQDPAPIDGTILKKNAEEGNLVNPIAMNGSYSLCDLADLSDLEVELTIEERDISKVFKDQKCKVRTEAYPDRIYEGFVSRLMPIADRNKAAIPVRVKVTVPRGGRGGLSEAGHDRHGFVLKNRSQDVDCDLDGNRLSFAGSRVRNRPCLHDGSNPTRRSFASTASTSSFAAAASASTSSRTSRWKCPPASSWA